MEYVNASGEIAYYYPDFIVRDLSGEIFIIETKGLQDVDVLPKWKRLVQWCADATAAVPEGPSYTPLFITQEDFDQLEKTVKTMSAMAELTKDREPIGA